MLICIIIMKKIKDCNNLIIFKGKNLFKKNRTLRIMKYNKWFHKIYYLKRKIIMKLNQI